MSGFSAAWLGLREPADHRARALELIGRLPRRFDAIVDLGCGTGSHLRWLAPRLESPQRWLLLDHDAELLAAATAEIEVWAERGGGQVRATRAGLEAMGARLENTGAELEVMGPGLQITGPGLDCSCTSVQYDLSRGLSALELPRSCLVTTAALLDLVSFDWLSDLVSRVATARASVLWALSYDGRIAITPAHDFDARLVALQNRHQLTDKGFGPALGPAAWRVAHELLEQAGYRVESRDSSWHCDGRDGALLSELVLGWAEAAVEIAPGDSESITHWRDERQRQIAAGELALTVGHRDLAAWPER
jgi:hypothetical protein